jgi:hypothetical protein
VGAAGDFPVTGRAASAAGTVAGALSADPTLAEREQRSIDVLGELLRRLAPLARRAARNSSAAPWPRPGRAPRTWGRAAARLLRGGLPPAGTPGPHQAGLR